MWIAKFKKTKTGKKKGLKSAKLANQILTDSQFHIKKKKKMLSFIYKFHFILYKFIQSFRIKRERETESLRES